MTYAPFPKIHNLFWTNNFFCPEETFRKFTSASQRYRKGAASRFENKISHLPTPIILSTSFLSLKLSQSLKYIQKITQNNLPVVILFTTSKKSRRPFLMIIYNQGCCGVKGLEQKRPSVCFFFFFILEG